MNPIDIVALVIIFVLALRCTFRGFIQEILSFAAPLVAGLAAFLFWKPLGAWGASLLPSLPVPGVIAAALLFLITFLAIKLLEHALTDAVETMRLGVVDRSLGFLVGALEGILICALLAAILQAQPFYDAGKLLSGSLFFKILGPFLPRAASNA